MNPPQKPQTVFTDSEPQMPATDGPAHAPKHYTNMPTQTSYALLPESETETEPSETQNLVVQQEAPLQDCYQIIKTFSIFGALWPHLYL